MNQSLFDTYQFLNPRNCPPQAPKMYVYAYIVHFEPARGEGGHPITIGGGASDINWGGSGELLSTTSKSNNKTLPYGFAL